MRDPGSSVQWFLPVLLLCALFACSQEPTEEKEAPAREEVAARQVEPTPPPTPPARTPTAAELGDGVLDAGREELAAREAAAPEMPPEGAAAASDDLGDWGLLCPDEDGAADDSEDTAAEGSEIAACRLFQNAILSVEAEEGAGAEQRRVMQTVVRFVADQEEPVLFVTVPLGILVPAGLRLEVEGYDMLRIPLQLCGSSGCVAIHPMKARLIDAFRQGGAAQVTFFDITRKPIQVRISTTGFGNAMAALRERAAG